jgi:hypothetical protein
MLYRNDDFHDCTYSQVHKFTISGRNLSFEKPIDFFLLDVVGSTSNATSSARDIGEMVFVVDIYDCY